MGTSIYYEDPERNVVELFVNNYESTRAATEYLRTAKPGMPAQIDPARLVAARKAGTPQWNLHERAMAGEFALNEPYARRAHF